MRQILLHPKYHLANRQVLEQYECFICYEISSKTVRCLGPCQKPICAKCYGRIKHTKDTCPSKCSSPFDCALMNELKCIYQCAFKAAGCHSVFTFEGEFQGHVKECEFAHQEDRDALRQKQNFLCDQNHSLFLLTPSLFEVLDKGQNSFYTSVMNEVCFGCGNRNLCRSLCLQCTTQSAKKVYCIECRRYPFDKNKCQQDHPYLLHDVSDKYVCVCDICGIGGPTLTNYGLYDQICDFYICSICYEQSTGEKLQKILAYEQVKGAQQLLKQMKLGNQ